METDTTESTEECDKKRETIEQTGIQKVETQAVIEYDPSSSKKSDQSEQSDKV